MHTHVTFHRTTRRFSSRDHSSCPRTLGNGKNTTDRTKTETFILLSNSRKTTRILITFQGFDNKKGGTMVCAPGFSRLYVRIKCLHSKGDTSRVSPDSAVACRHVTRFVHSRPRHQSSCRHSPIFGYEYVVPPTYQVYLWK